MIDSLRTMRRVSSLDSLGYEAPAVLPQLTTEPAAGPLAAMLCASRSRPSRARSASFPQSSAMRAAAA